MRMLSLATLALLGACALRTAAPTAPLDSSQAIDTMRVDYFHRGGPGGESVTLDGVANDGSWPGSRTQLVDETGLGNYFFEVIDRASRRVLYSRGFDSIYGEWETTAEVRSVDRTFHESLRFPWPTDPVRVVVRKRDRQNVFQELWATDIDPDSRAVGRHRPQEAGRVSPVFESGPPGAKIDLLLLSEGYAPGELSRFRADAARLVEALFALEPFKSRRADFNVRTLGIAGAPFSVEFNIFGIERYALTYDNRSLRNLAASAPYDVLEILVNHRGYGGGGIFNQQSTVAAGNGSAEYVFIHEFAHNFAGLADEYVGSVTYEAEALRRAEPWEPNITARADRSALKWRDLVEPDTPLPTPLTYAGKVGAFEGGGYQARGVYRPEAECIMGSRETIPFCRVCQRAISRIIDVYTR